jgi:hypothetical protein
LGAGGTARCPLANSRTSMWLRESECVARMALGHPLWGRRPTLLHCRNRSLRTPRGCAYLSLPARKEGIIHLVLCRNGSLQCQGRQTRPRTIQRLTLLPSTVVAYGPYRTGKLESANPKFVNDKTQPSACDFIFDCVIELGARRTGGRAVGRRPLGVQCASAP